MNHSVGAHCASLVGLNLARCSGALDLGAISRMGSNTLSDLLVDRTVAGAVFALALREMEVDAFEMQVSVASSLVNLDLPRSRHREVVLEVVMEGVYEAEAVKFQHLG